MMSFDVSINTSIEQLLMRLRRLDSYNLDIDNELVEISYLLEQQQHLFESLWLNNLSDDKEIINHYLFNSQILLTQLAKIKKLSNSLA